jgi:hypothetical protein
MSAGYYGHPGDVQYDEFGREIRLRHTASSTTTSSSAAPRRERSPPRQRRDRSRSPRPRDGSEYEYKRELNRYKDTHLDEPSKARASESKSAAAAAAAAATAAATASKTASAAVIELPKDLPEEDMMKLLGLPSSFDTTHEKHVEGADMSAARVVKKRQARQYMNIVKKAKPGGPAYPMAHSRIKR